MTKAYPNTTEFNICYCPDGVRITYNLNNYCKRRDKYMIQFKNRNLEGVFSEYYNNDSQYTYDRINMIDELRRPLYNNLQRYIMRDMYGGESDSDDEILSRNM